MKHDRLANILHIGKQGNDLKFAGMILYVRRRAHRIVRGLLQQVEQAMAAGHCSQAE